MAYFDSPKNRAIWEKELAGLRRKKELAAKQTGEIEASALSRETIREPMDRIPITFEQLIQEAQEKRQGTAKKEWKQMERKEKDSRQIEGRKKVKGYAVFLGFLLCLLCPFTDVKGGQAQETLFFAGEDEAYGYRYEAPGIGSLSSSVREGDTAAVVVLAVDEARYLLYQNGNRKQYEAGDILYETGDYKLYLYSSETEQTRAEFTFQIENDFESLDEDMEPGKTVVNPDLILDYDKSQAMYRYTLPNGSGFLISVPSGGIAEQPVTLRLMDGSSLFMVFCNGEAEPVPEDMAFTKQGRYRMTIISSASITEKRDRNLYKSDICFIIGTGSVNQMEILNAPTGFLLDAVTYNGRSLKPDGDTFIRLLRDGVYRAVFVAEENDKINWQITFKRDTSPPCLIFNQPMNGGQLDSPVSYTVPEPGCSVSVKFNGILMPNAKNHFTEGGYYEVTVKDPPGNERAYNFFIEGRYQLADQRIVIIFAAVFTAAAVYFAHCRKNMQIL